MARPAGPDGDRARRTERRPPALLAAGVTAMLLGGAAAAAAVDVAADPARNATYVVDGRAISLVDGISDLELAPGSASRLITRSLAEPQAADLNADGRRDWLLLLAQSGGGSGTFHYLAAALQTPAGTMGSEGYLLGDRIEPLSITVDDAGVVEVRINVRAADDPLAAPPSRLQTLRLRLDPGGRRFQTVGPEPAGPAATPPVPDAGVAP